MKAEQQYIDLYTQYHDLICEHSAEVLNAAREHAFAEFVRLGFPSKKLEKYKYTDIGKLFEPDFGMNIKQIPVDINPYDVFSSNVPNMSTSLFFIANDSFYSAGSSGSNLPQGVLAGSLKQMAQTHPALVERYYGKLADVSSDGVTAFNTVFAQDGFFIYVPRGVVVDKPIQLINVFHAETDLLVSRRILVVLEEASSAKLLICDHTIDDNSCLANQVIEVFVGDGASLDLYELEENNDKSVRISNLYLQQGAGSNVQLGGMTLMGGVTRNMTQTRFAGEGSELGLYGMALCDGSQVVDSNTYVDHAYPHCTSNQLFKFVMDGQSVGAFAGLVMVEPGAHHTSSQQTNRNLCVTREARMYTQPQLEIYNDDVKCSHGAAVGQLDETALFYMRQRGISLKEARHLLMYAFVGEVLNTIRINALRERLQLLVDKRLRGELGKGCDSCDICRK